MHRGLTRELQRDLGQGMEGQDKGEWLPPARVMGWDGMLGNSSSLCEWGVPGTGAQSSISGSAQRQAGRGWEQPGITEDVPAHGRGGMRGCEVPSHPDHSRILLNNFKSG